MAQSPLFINWLTNQPIPITPGVIVPPVRVPLTSSLTIFVDQTNGSDSNNGSTAALAFKTLQAAYNFLVQFYDFQGQTVVIQHASGETVTNSLTILSAWTGGGNIILDLGGSTWNCTSANDLVIECPLPGTFTVQNAVLQTTTAGACLAAQFGGVIIAGTGLTFGSCAGSHIFAASNSIVLLTAAYTVNGNAVLHYQTQFGGGIGFAAGAGFTVTVTGTPTFTDFVLCQIGAWINAASITYSGAATGTRYSANAGVIFTNGGGANFFPGSIAGSTSNGGQYL